MVDIHAVTPPSPVDRPDAAHLIVSGTGPTHLGSADGCDKMLRAAPSIRRRPIR